MHRFLFISLLLISGRFFAAEKVVLHLNNASVEYTNVSVLKNKPSPVWFNFFKRKANRKKMIASALAFPVPGGILGLHRIYLGTEPYVPLIYIFTLGGGLILPVVDFCVLLSNKDISRFEKHKGIFMWIDNEKKPTENKTN